MDDTAASEPVSTVDAVRRYVADRIAAAGVATLVIVLGISAIYAPFGVYYTLKGWQFDSAQHRLQSWAAIASSRHPILSDFEAEASKRNLTEARCAIIVPGYLCLQQDQEYGLGLFTTCYVELRVYVQPGSLLISRTVVDRYCPPFGI